MPMSSIPIGIGANPLERVSRGSRAKEDDTDGTTVLPNARLHRQQVGEVVTMGTRLRW